MKKKIQFKAKVNFISAAYNSLEPYNFVLVPKKYNRRFKQHEPIIVTIEKEKKP